VLPARQAGKEALSVSGHELRSQPHHVQVEGCDSIGQRDGELLLLRCLKHDGLEVGGQLDSHLGGRLVRSAWLKRAVRAAERQAVSSAAHLAGRFRSRIFEAEGAHLPKGSVSK
jgi:hypothetical protein